MTYAYFIYTFPARLSRLTSYTDLAKNDFRMFQSDWIIIDHKYTHVMRRQAGFINLLLPIRFTQRKRYRECGSFSFFADNIDVAIHELYDTFGNGHA